MQTGGDEPLPVFGHLGGGEPMVKPTVRSVLYFIKERVVADKKNTYGTGRGPNPEDMKTPLV